MRPAFLGIIGCGAMGRLIARHIREQLPSYRLGGLFSRTTAHAEGLALELGDANSAMPEPSTSWTSVTPHSDDAPSREEASSRPTPHTAMPIVAMMSAPCLSAIRPPSGEINT